MNENNFASTVEQASAFQKMWMESLTKTMQAGFTMSPTTPPSDMLLQFRGGIFKALAESWEEFMRSPQFLQGMQEVMEHTVTFRKMTTDLFGKVRAEMQSPSRDDVDAIMVGVRHIEKRLLDRVDELSANVTQLKTQLDSFQPPRPARKSTATNHKARAKSQDRQKES